ncbi:unnamed protein product [Coffea canephora]|uniref:DH200=94 genomic scaffold, scaffold_1092 n=1 Tax=Coffea canephora TaxID=49390 RepID=A0A068VI83_COFCA|nr:unnamed protein product [Coffea canephora]
MELPFNFIAFFLFLAFVLCLIKEWKRSKAAQKLPPSPLKLPVIGNMHHLVGSPPHHALRKLARQHGALMHLQLGEISSIVVSSPHLAKEIMKTHDLAFANRAEFLTSKILMYNSSDIACCPYGDYWRQMRKICTLELLSAKNVRSFGSIRQDEASHLVASVQALATAGELINISEKLYSYTSSMILHPLLSAKSQLVKIHLKMDKLLGNIIDQHIDNLARTNMATGESGNEDLIDVLLRVKESGDLQFPITNNNIKAIVIDVFSAGTETSSTTVEWAMSEMVRNPNVMAKAQSEIRTAFKGKKKIEETDIQELKYLRLVIKETLRLHPPGPLLVPRECREECEIEGYTIPVKTRVLINAWAIGRDPDYWNDPESFKPERFKSNPVDFTGTHFEYLPFGAGRRMCPGISFGLANVHLPLALLLYHFDWKLPDGLDPCDLDMSETVGITASRKDSLRLLATSYDPYLQKPY